MIARALVMTSLILVATVSAPGDAQRGRRARPPAAVGTCAFTTITRVGYRLEDGVTHRPMRDSGSAVTLANGVYGVSYESVPAIQNSRRGDRAFTCLISIPQHCPPGDARGRVYTTTNMRTEESWTLPDSEHSCGGA